ncbi:MAG: ASPIC/UnbV domain-containing protein, partial [Proteobacteria bacterium]|nr:ASPIC/UnbV domain-containing protein [Pseudomonadota bacterium]
GVARGGWGWGSCFADFDNDGHLDIVHVNGWNKLDDRAENDYTSDQVRLFRGQGDGTFVEQSDAAGLTDKGQGRGIACFDADRDGLLDILISNNDSDHLVFYRNTSAVENHYVAVRLESNVDNRFGIGDRVTATTDDGSQVREIRIGNNFTSHNPAEAHFGLGQATQVDIEVRWPDGSISALSGLAADQMVTVSRNVVTGQRLIVDGGSGGGRFDVGNQIAIEALPAAPHYYFSHWTSNGGGSFADASEPSTTFTMPDATVRITAHYLPGVSPDADVSLARRWNEVLLQAIRNDFARPTVHARNLFHISAAVYDAWAAYDATAEPWLLGRTRAGEACSFDALSAPADVTAARQEALSYAAYRMIRHRFVASPRGAQIRRDADALMSASGLDPAVESDDYSGGSAAALGNHIADCYIRFGLADGANEANSYANVAYSPVNPALAPDEPGNPDIVDLNRWQPLRLAVSIDQAGNPISSQPEFLGPEWGIVVPFSLSATDLTIYQRDGFDYWVYHDPGPPPTIDGPLSDNYKWTHSLVAKWSSHLDPSDGVMVDISPASLGNIQSYPTRFEDYPDFYDTLQGGDPSTGYEFNPVTGLPYEPQMVPRGDYTRVLAEFWADGPDSETPPGHWFVIVNEVNDHPLLERRFEGVGPELPMLEWDVKTYFTLGGAMHDTAITAWGIKGWYDYIRPISSLRAMADRGQSSDDTLGSYDLDGIPLEPGYIELVDEDDPLAGDGGEHVGKIKLRAWKGPDFIDDPAVDEAGVDWILAENWWPYQRPSFVTPPFAGYVSGHSTYSRAAAELLTRLTGSEYFPGGMSGFEVKANEFLVFEQGPSVDMTLEWAKYYDASDQCSLSRIWGGIHPPADDIPGRLIGMQIGPAAFERANAYFEGAVAD